MSSFSTGHNEVNLARRANIRRVNRVSNAGRAVICPHPFASIHVRRGIEAMEGGGVKKRINLVAPVEEETSVSATANRDAIRDNAPR